MGLTRSIRYATLTLALAGCEKPADKQSEAQKAVAIADAAMSRVNVVNSVVQALQSRIEAAEDEAEQARQAAESAQAENARLRKDVIGLSEAHNRLVARMGLK